MTYIYLIHIIHIISIMSAIIAFFYLSQKQYIYSFYAAAISMGILIYSELNVNLIYSLLPASIIGYYISSKMKMYDLPQLIALFHSFIGIVAIPISFYMLRNMCACYGLIHIIECLIGSFMGAITFSGSILAFYKLSYNKDLPIFLCITISKIMIGILCIFNIVIFSTFNIEYIYIYKFQLLFLYIISGLILGISLINPIGGADMPVVMSLLNAASGYSIASIGILTKFDLLISIGAIIGASGLFLSYKMCKAMNRSIFNLYRLKENKIELIHTQDKYNIIDLSQAISMIKNSKNIIIVPGYGLAASKAQQIVADLGKKIKAKYILHPIAGRMPGHMNILLAEANVPNNDIVKDIDFAQIDLAIVIGANDIVNPLALNKEISSPIQGMPIIHVYKAKNVICIKRSIQSQGYSKIDNELFTMNNVKMLLGDARSLFNKIYDQLDQD